MAGRQAARSARLPLWRTRNKVGPAPQRPAMHLAPTRTRWRGHFAGATAAPRFASADAAILLTAFAILLWGAGVARMRMDPLQPGFAHLAHPFYLGAIAVLGIAFVMALRQPAASRTLLLTQVAVLVVFLHLTPFLVEGVARFRTNWRNFGYAEWFERHENAAPDLIWYHNWPAFFIEGNAVAHAWGADVNTLLGVWPTLMALVVTGCALGLFASLFEGAPRRTFTAAWLFASANWINQELFGPQPLAFAAFLVLVALVLEAVRRKGAWGDAPVGRRIAILLLLAALALLHPLTSVLFVAGLTVLAITSPPERRLVLISALVVLLWFAFGAYDYLLWKLGSYLEELGDPLAILERGFGRSAEGSAEGAYVGRLRTLYTVAVCALGAAALFVKRAWRVAEERAVAMWAGVPFLFVGGFSYDGEILLRIFLFALAPFAYFVARTLWDGRVQVGARAWRASALVVPVLLLPATLHPVVHYGEERLEFVHAREVEGMRTFYARAEDDARILPFSSNSVAETFRRDDIGIVWYGYVNWTPDGRLDWTKADAELGEGPFTGAQYAWLADGDRQEFELRLGAYGAHDENLTRLRASPYAGIYDSGGLRIFYVAPQRANEEAPA